MQISREYFDMSVSFKKTSISGKFHLSSKNNIVFKNFVKNGQIFTFYNSKHPKKSIFSTFTKLIFFGAGGKKTNILRYMKRTVLFCPLFRVLVWLSIVENKKVRSNLFELNFDSFSTYWNYDFSLKWRIFQCIFDTSSSFKKTSAPGKFDLSSKNNISEILFHEMVKISPFSTLNTKNIYFSIVTL